MMGSYPREINVQNALEYSWALLLAKWKCIHESFPFEYAQSTYFIWSGKAYTSYNLLHTLIFFSTKTTGLA